MNASRKKNECSFFCRKKPNHFWTDTKCLVINYAGGFLQSLLFLIKTEKKSPNIYSKIKLQLCQSLNPIIFAMTRDLVPEIINSDPMCITDLFQNNYLAYFHRKYNTFQVFLKKILPLCYVLFSADATMFKFCS